MVKENIDEWKNISYTFYKNNAIVLKAALNYFGTYDGDLLRYQAGLARHRPRLIRRYNRLILRIITQRGSRRELPKAKNSNN